MHRPADSPTPRPPTVTPLVRAESSTTRPHTVQHEKPSVLSVSTSTSAQHDWQYTKGGAAGRWKGSDLLGPWASLYLQLLSEL